jgi:hypothetical protein
MSSEEEIDILIRAAYPIICIYSHEERRVEAAIQHILRKKDRKLGANSPVLYWSITEGLCKLDGSGVAPDICAPMAILEHIGKSDKPGIFILRDFYNYMSGPAGANIQRKLKDLAYYLTTQASQRHIVIIGHHFEIPPSIEKLVAVIDFSLPSEDELEGVLKESLSIVQLGDVWKALKSNKSGLEQILQALKGLTRFEAENVLAKSLVSTGGIDVYTILNEKKHIIKKSGVLEFYEPSADMASVGGLESLKQWLHERGKAFSSDARKYGLPVPKGVLILGIPGTGKSLISKAIGIAWSMPVLRMDIGALFGSLVGQSEANMRKALKTAEALAPCVLWINRSTLNYVNCWNPLRAAWTTA